MDEPGRHPSASGGLAWRDLVTAAVMFAIGAWVWVETAGWAEARNLAQDPSVLPRGIAVALWAAGVMLLVKEGARVLAPSARNGATGAVTVPDIDEREGETADEPPTPVRALVLLAGITAYVWAAFRVGYAVTTWIFLVAAVVLLGGERSPLRLLVIGLVAAGGTAVVWLGFTELLNVRMPNTWLP